MTDLEQQIANAKHAGIAKALSHRVPDSQSWDDTRAETMRELLGTKALADPIFRSALLETEKKTIAHTVHDTLWGTGFSPELTFVTRPTHWGKNMMGHLLMELRAEIRAAMQRSSTLCRPSQPEDHPPTSASAPTPKPYTLPTKPIHVEQPSKRSI